MAESTADPFPCKLTLDIPFPSTHLASTALRVLSVDAELSPLVRRSFELASLQNDTNSTADSSTPMAEQQDTVLRVRYEATTNRMLRVAVNGFFESVGVIIGVMKELDVDVVYGGVEGGLEGVQGLEGVKG